MDCSPPGSSVHGDCPGNNTGVGCHALLQGIFSTQGLNPDLSQCRQILYHLSHQESPLDFWAASSFPPFTFLAFSPEISARVAQISPKLSHIKSTSEPTSLRILALKLQAHEKMVSHCDLTCIITNESKHVFMCLCAVHVFSFLLWNVYSCLWPIFLLSCHIGIESVESNYNPLMVLYAPNVFSLLQIIFSLF